ncbi:hypothetical protein ACFQ1L_08065 [Phytohabitans flavus]|uniref:hypothetical protein n=1 Tax=Phytohabitans flavus TaxID=1076124 RepID=UPI001567475F|nr:hypothetical protein [Phytohabitans flavus]
MSIRGWLLLACGGFGATYLVGEFFGSPLLPAAELLAWVSLAAYLAVSGRGAPTRVRFALAAGVLILGAIEASSLLSTADGSRTGMQFLTPDRVPERSALDTASDAVRHTMPALVAYACLALAALFLPKRRTRTSAAVAVAGIGIAVIYVGLEIWGRDGGLAAVLAAVPLLLVAVLAFLVAGRTPRWIPTAGLALLGLAALWMLDGVLDRVHVEPLVVFLDPGMRYQRHESVAVMLAAPVGLSITGLALAPAIQLAAAATITVGCLRRRAASPPPPDASAPSGL